MVNPPYVEDFAFAGRTGGGCSFGEIDHACATATSAASTKTRCRTTAICWRLESRNDDAVIVGECRRLEIIDMAYGESYV